MNVKKCNKCGKTKSLDEYHLRGKNKQWVYSQCKKCFSEMVCNRYIILKQKAIDYKGGKCMKCGYNKYYGALQFHHRDPSEKEYSWNALRKRAWKSIVKELDKCDLLCANCHSEHHGGIE